MQDATTSLPSASQFYLAHYERNGHSDSDFLVVFFDRSTGSIGQHEYGSTRYAANPGGDAFFAGLRRDISDEVRAEIRDTIRTKWAALLTAEDSDCVLTPSPAQVSHGTEVRFAAAPGKRSKACWAIGDVGEIFWSKAYGTFYKNGYNHPDRANTRVGVRLANGTTVFAPLSALRLNREVDTEGIAQQADRAARELRFELLVPGWTWATGVNPVLAGPAFALGSAA